MIIGSIYQQLTDLFINSDYTTILAIILHFIRHTGKHVFFLMR